MLNSPYEAAAAVGATSPGRIAAPGLCENSGQGRHVKVKHADGRVIVFPHHDEVDRYTLKGALRDADVEIEEFLRKVK